MAKWMMGGKGRTRTHLVCMYVVRQCEYLCYEDLSNKGTLGEIAAATEWLTGE